MELGHTEPRESPILSTRRVPPLFHVLYSQNICGALHRGLELAVHRGNIIKLVETSYQHKDSRVWPVFGRVCLVFIDISPVHPVLLPIYILESYKPL